MEHPFMQPPEDGGAFGHDSLFVPESYALPPGPRAFGVLPSKSADPDTRICEDINNLRSMAWDFADSFPAVSAPQQPHVLDNLFKRQNDQLVRYIGCLAMGGKDGMEGWRALLADTDCCKALVFGIVGRAMKEKVFSELYFGAPPNPAETLSIKEQEQVQDDGFFRTMERASMISQAKSNDIATLRKAVARTTMQLEQMLLPLWNQGGSATIWKSKQMRHRLTKIVHAAANLSREMRVLGDTICYWPPTFKDDEFEPGRMECLNLSDMIKASPYDKKTVNGSDRAILRPNNEDQSEAVVRVVCFPGLIAYRQHGGDLAKRELDEENRRPDTAPSDVRRHRMQGQGGRTGEEGFRTRVLCKSVVLLQWGRQRWLKKEAGTSAHLDDMKVIGGMKKYTDDYTGFVELYDEFRKRCVSEPAPSAVQSENDSQRRITSWPLRFPSWGSQPPSG